MSRRAPVPAQAGRRGLAVSAGAVLLACAAASPLAAQGQQLAERCPSPPPGLMGADYCPRVAHAIGILQPRLAVLTAAGNPVPGTASTLGTRLGSLPRVSLAVRLSGVSVQIPGVTSPEAGAPRGLNTLAFSGDAAVGVFPGLALLPTVGGFGSLDALASLGVVLPAGGGFARGRPLTWGAGARLGILRESFTMPGVALSGMVRGIGAASYGDPSLERYSTHFTIDRTRVLSARLAVTKRLFVINTTAGVGWDRATSTVSILVDQPPLPLQPPVRATGFRSDRTHGFLNAAWTTLILNLVAEVGVQEGGDADRVLQSVRGAVRRRGVYGSLAARLAI